MGRGLSIGEIKMTEGTRGGEEVAWGRARYDENDKGWGNEAGRPISHGGEDLTAWPHIDPDDHEGRHSGVIVVHHDAILLGTTPRSRRF